MTFLKLAVLSVLLTSAYSATVKPSQFRVIMEWKVLNFTWPNEIIMQNYTPKNCLIAGVNYYEDYYYLTLPRMKSGIPATLTRVPVNGNTSPTLTPYPTWEMNELNNCVALQNTQNIEIDSKGRMWILDSGRTTTLSMRNNVNECPPKLVIYDIKMDSIIKTYEFPRGVVDRSKSYLYDIVVDETDGDYAYISDNSIKDPGLIVYSFKMNHAWKLRHETMFADLKAAEFRINNVVVTTPINIAGIALGPKMQKNDTSLTIHQDRAFYYCPLSSYHLYSISTAVLKNESTQNDSKVLDESIKDVGIKASQTDGMIMDSEGILYYSLLGSNSISMWDTSLPFASAQKVIARDANHIQWPNSFAFDMDGNLITLTNNLHKYVFDTLNLNEVNFRLLESHTGTKSYIYADSDLEYSHTNDTTTVTSTIIQSSPSSTTTAEEDYEEIEDEDTDEEIEDEPEDEETDSTSSTLDSSLSKSSTSSDLWGPSSSTIILNSTNTEIGRPSLTTQPITSNTSTTVNEASTNTKETLNTKTDASSLTAYVTEQALNDTSQSSSDYSKLSFTVIIITVFAFLC